VGADNSLGIDSYIGVDMVAFLVFLTIIVLVTLVASSAHNIANENREIIKDLNWRVNQLEDGIKKPRSA
jgi:hypothetical protein